MSVTVVEPAITDKVLEWSHYTNLRSALFKKHPDFVIEVIRFIPRYENVSKQKPTIFTFWLQLVEDVSVFNSFSTFLPDIFRFPFASTDTKRSPIRPGLYMAPRRR